MMSMLDSRDTRPVPPPPVHPVGDVHPGGPVPPGGPVHEHDRSHAPGRRQRVWPAVVASAAGAAVVASVATAGLTGAFDGDDAPARTPAAISDSQGENAPVSSSTSANPQWQAVASAVTPAVVAIDVVTPAGEGQGTGFVIDTAGHVLTNNHVVAGAVDDTVEVTLSDGRVLSAKVVGLDPTTDLAVLALVKAPADLAVASLGTSGDLAVGQPVMAVGNPLGLASTATTGIISALDRPVSTTDGNETIVTNAIQIDAAINPGNSGGPLFDAQGRVVGITSSIATLPGAGGRGGSIGLGFAIPVDLAAQIADQLIADGEAEHSYLGVSIADGTAEVDGVTRRGATVREVSADSPAAAAGVKTGDVITAIDGKAVDGSEALTGFVRSLPTGQVVTLDVVRDGAATTLDVTLAARVTPTAAPTPPAQDEQGQGTDPGQRGGPQWPSAPGDGSDPTDPGSIPGLEEWLFPQK